MKTLTTLLVATLALAIVSFAPDIASAGHGHGGHGWHGGGHWHGGHAWRGGRGWHAGVGPAGNGWWGPGMNIFVGGYGRRCWSPAYGYYPCLAGVISV
jgi:hypothetical protein